MTEKHHDNLRKKHAGLLSRLIFAFVKTVVISMLAWFCLTLWFIGKAIFYGQASAINSTQQIITENFQFIRQYPSYLTKYFFYYFDKAQQLTGHLMKQMAAWNITLLQSAANLLINITEIHLTRLLILVMASPLFIVALLIAITDGLVKRDIRKFQGARESTLIFHKMKSLIGVCFFVPLFIYLSFPFAVNPILILLPQIILMGLVIALSITYFKKYV